MNVTLTMEDVIIIVTTLLDHIIVPVRKTISLNMTTILVLVRTIH